MTHQYQDHFPLIVKVLGRESALAGDGHEAFVHASRTWDPEKGKFSTWLYHNLQFVRFQAGAEAKKNPHPNQFVEIDEALGLNEVSDPSDIIEFRDELSCLSDDAKAIIECLFRDISNVSKRTRWPEATTCNKGEVKRYLKEYCRETLNWSWPRYWSAVHEIQEVLR